MDYSIARKVILDCFKGDNITYEKAPVLTVAHDNDRSLLYEGKYYAPLIDTMEDDLARKSTRCVSVARIISTIKGDLAYGNVFSPEGGFARALIQKRLLGAISRKTYPYSSMEESVWGNILDKTKAKKVFGIQPSRELCVACRKRGIWVADVQHGVISESHPWYGSHFRGNDPLNYLPHAFLCWDYGSHEVIVRWAAAKGISTVITGNRWVARFVRPRAEDTMVTKLFGAYKEEGINPGNKPAILVTLSWGNVNIPNAFMAEALQGVIRATSDHYHWSVRLHPNQLKGFATHEGRRFPAYLRANLEGLVEWKVATRFPLPLILCNTDLHISWNSSVAIEAAQMGVPSALLCPRLRASGDRSDYYDYYRRKGMILLIEDTKPAICGWIEANLHSRAAPEEYGVYDDAYRQLINFLAD